MTGSQSAAGPVIYGVPLALWIAVGVAVLSAIITLVSVAMSNRNSRSNLREQLRLNAEQFAAQLTHDSEQRERERAMSLRREVYLEAAAALSHTSTVIGRLADIYNDQKALAEDFAADLAKIGKVHIVGSAQTVQAIMNYLNVVGPSFAELVAKRVPLTIRKSAIDLESAFMDTAMAERKRFTAMMQQLNLDGVRDDAKWEPIKRQSVIATETYNAHAQSRQTLWSEQLKDTFALAQFAFAVAERVIPLLYPAILSVRSEMDAPLDPEWYATLWAEQVANMRRVTETTFGELQKINASEVNEAGA